MLTHKRCFFFYVVKFSNLNCYTTQIGKIRILLLVKIYFGLVQAKIGVDFRPIEGQIGPWSNLWKYWECYYRLIGPLFLKIYCLLYNYYLHIRNINFVKLLKTAYHALLLSIPIKLSILYWYLKKESIE